MSDAKDVDPLEPLFEQVKALGIIGQYDDIVNLLDKAWEIGYDQGYDVGANSELIRGWNDKHSRETY
jgi:hypothetical protein